MKHKDIYQHGIHLRLLLGVALFFISSSITHAAFQFHPDLNWRTLQSPHFNIHFHDGEEALAQKAAVISERVHIELSKYFKWQPKGATEMVLIDQADITNGMATPLPRNTIMLFMTPPEGATDNLDDWLDYVITHEYTHILHMDKATGSVLRVRNLLGRLSILFPAALQPLWAIEGLATYKETDETRFRGRGNSSLFRALMITELQSGLKPIRQANLNIESWPGGQVPYLYGVYFYHFLRDTYGEEHIKRWITNYSDNLLPFFINSNSHSVFSKDLSQMWVEFEKYLNTRFKPITDRIKQAGLSNAIALTHDGYLNSQPRSLSNGDVFYISHDLQSKAKLMRLRNSQQLAEPITEILGGRFDVHITAGVVISQIDAIDSTQFYSDLYHINIETGATTQLTNGQRYTFASWSPDGKNIIAVHNKLGSKSLHLLDAQGQLIEILWQGKNDEVISQPDWSPDGNSILAPVWRKQSRWNLEVFSLNNKTWSRLTNNRFNETQAQYSADGKQIFYCADYDGIYNIYSFDLDSKQIKRRSNTMSGAYSVTYNATNNAFYYAGLNKKGYDIYRLPTSSAITQDIEHTTLAPLPAEVYNNLQNNTRISKNYNTKAYSPFESIKPTFWLPAAFTLADNYTEVGIITGGRDTLGRHNYQLLAIYDADNGWPSGQIDYLYDRWNPSLKLSFSREILKSGQDISVKADSFRAVDDFAAEIIFPWLKRDYQWSLHFAWANYREKDLLLVPPTLPLPNYEDQILGTAVSFNSADHYSRSISVNTGHLIRVVYEDSDTLKSDFSGQVSRIDWRGYFSLGGQQVLATRILLGTGDDNSRPFQLGGIDRGYFLSSPAETIAVPTVNIFNRRQFALRGYDDNLIQLRGKRMALAELEWRFPISLIERSFMAPPIGIKKIHGRIFYNAGEAWNTDADKQSLAEGAGLELHTELVFGYFIPINLRLGYAQGFEDFGEEQVYLSAGATF